MFLVVSAAAASAKVGKLVIPPLLPAITTALSISAFEAGIALSISALMVALTQYPSGRYSDGLSRKTAITTSLGCFIVGFGVLTVTTTYGIFLLGTILIGLGDGMYAPAARALISDLFVKRRSQAFGIHMVAIDIGGIIASGAAAIIISMTIWRAAFPPVLVVLTVLLPHRLAPR